jgi:WD40 repeat protein
VSAGSASTRRAAGLIDFALERQRHRRFVGREDVLARLDEWLLGPAEAGWIVVTGGPGMGKSAILSSWLARREAAGVAVPHHFVRRQVVDWDQPEAIAASLAAQIEAVFPELCDAEARPEARLLELLGRVSKRLGASGRLVLVVDGLDETRAEPGENPLPRFLPHVVPSGIRILCATRPTYPHLSWIEARTPARRLDLDDARWAASNEAVVRGFWAAVAPEYQPPLPPETVTAAIARAEGNVLHAVMLHDALRDAPAPLRRADRIPRGLKGLIGEIWERAAAHERVRAGLGLLCAAQEALSLDVLGELAGWSYDHKERFVREARQLLLEEPAAWAGAEAYRPRHDWVRELMAERLGAAALRAHHRTLARQLATWPAPAEATARRYALRHALVHRAEAGEWADAWRLAADMSFVEAKCRELGVHELEAEIARVAERCRAGGDEALGRRFGDLARALGRESHWLRAAPAEATALAWNRLRRFGWSAEELDRELQTSAETTFLLVRHVATRESPALVRDLVGHSGPVNACAVTPDGRRVVSASFDGTLKVWDLESGRVLATLMGHASGVIACAITADGERVVSTSSDRTLKAWDVERECALITLRGHTGWVRACALTADERRVLSGSSDGTMKVWDLESGRMLATLEGHGDRVSACAITADSQRVVSGGLAGALHVWDLESGRVLTALEGHDGGVNACTLAGGQRIVSASIDRTLKVWDLESGRSLVTLTGHTFGVNACAVTADGRRVISASDDKTLKVWDIENGQTLATFEGHTLRVNGCAVTADARHVISASDDGALKVWALESGRAVTNPDVHRNWVAMCALTADGRRMVSTSWDKTLKVWNVESGRVLATLQGHTAEVNACAMMPDGRRLISASTDQTLKVWDLESGDVLTTLKGHAAWVSACAMTQDGRRVISASGDKTLRIWDIERACAIATLRGHDDTVRACAVMADDRRVVSASEDWTLKIWDLESGDELATLRGHDGPLRACAITADGSRVISGSRDCTLRIWDLDTGRVLAILDGHTEGVRACAVTPDGQHVISVSDDRTLKVWNLDTHACIYTHRGNAAYTAVTATATAIIAGDAGGSMWFMDWPRSSRRAMARQSSHVHGGLRESRPENEPQSSRQPMKKHTILFLAANPTGTNRLALDQEAHAIQAELERAGYRDCFELVTRWAAEPLDLLREMRRVKPTVVHFSGHGSRGLGGEQQSDPGPRGGGGGDQRPKQAARRDVSGELGAGGDEPPHGLCFQGPDGRARVVSAAALKETFGAAGASVQLVVLSACYSEVQAEALLAHVDCVVGMSGAIHDDAARSFAIGFYGGLGERESVAAAYRQGRAAISLEGLRDADRPQLKIRAGVDADRLVLAADPR